MSVDFELQPILDLIETTERPTPTIETVEELRAGYSTLASALGAGEPTVVPIDVTAGGVQVRVYRPEGVSAPLPALVWLHGCGFVIGDLDTHDALCRDLSHGARCAVISVDYRLAPEHACPAAHDDAFEATGALLEQAETLGIDASRWAIGGDSAGAHLATVTCRRRRDPGDPLPAVQLLVYPIADLAEPDADESYHMNAEGHLLTAETLRFFADAYVPDQARRAEPDASLIRTRDLRGMPPALVITAEYDPLRDEGEQYSQLLAEAGVPTTLTRYDGAIHMFAQMGGTAQGRRSTAQLVDRLVEAFSEPAP